MCQQHLENTMKALLTALALGVSLTANADTILPTHAIDTFAITTTSKLVLASNQESYYVAPFNNCSMESITRMKEPNIFFSRNRVQPESTVTIYDKTNRRHAVRCTIEKLEHIEKDYLALR